MDLLGIRLVGVDEGTLTKFLLTGAAIVLALVLQRGVGVAAGFTETRSIRAIWIRKSFRLAIGVVAVLFIASVWFDRPERLATFGGLIAAGAAVASQKAILSLAGYFVIVFGKVFDLGDRIQVGDVRGDVLDIGLFKTTVMEMGVPAALLPHPNHWVTSRQYTGRIVTFTNSEVFEKPAYNYSRTFDFLWEEMRFGLHYEEDLQKAERIALEVARQHTAQTVAEGRDNLERLRRRFPLQAADLEPRTYLRMTDNWVELALRFLVRAWGTRATKDAMTREILARYRAEGITIASASFEVARLPELTVKPAEAPAGDAPRRDPGA
jgi:small-conductance mechanosensitive channel